MHFFSGYVPAWLVLNGSIAISLALAVLATAAYVWLRPGDRFRSVIWKLLVAGIVLRALLALYFSFGQFVVWSGTELGKLFLPPNQSWWYFLTYVGERYVLEVVLALVLASLWYGFLRLVGNRSERYLDRGELELTTLLVFASGWPDALVMAPLAGLILVAYAIVRMVFFRRQYTTLGVPFMLATMVTIACAQEIRVMLGY